ncbi:unnamed protein product [Linum tenue]|uniref:Protein SDA1 n=1 Tax=Linum tenue TaxID=586396 RepID=A0AAV0I6X9_9ROSI|nr:unnamed protein product [Linum tenue]
MIEHKEEIFSRPKATAEKENGSGKGMISAQQAEDLKMKAKRKREHERNLPRKLRRKLQAAREMLEDEEDEVKPMGSGKDKKEKAGLSLVDLGYRRAKAVKAVKRAKDSGKFVEKKAPNKSKRPSQRNQSRTEEMKDLFQTDMSDRKQLNKGSSSGLRKKAKSSFKSKSRYKRR